MSNNIDFGKSQEIKKYPKKTYMMETEPPYGVCGPNQFLEEKGTHLLIDLDQMKRACKDPLTEGPKIILECMNNGNIPVTANKQKLSDTVRKIQNAADRKKLESDKAEEEKKNADKHNPPEPEQVGSESTGNSSIDAVIEMLKEYDNVGDIKTYAKETLGMESSDFPGNPGKDKVLEAIQEHFRKG